MLKIIVALYVLVTSAALIVIKLSTSGSVPVLYSNSKVHFSINILTIVGLFLYGLSFLTYLYLISKFDLGYIIPVTTGLVYIIIFTASYLIFREVFTIWKIIGISLIILGLIFINIKK